MPSPAVKSGLAPSAPVEMFSRCGILGDSRTAGRDSYQSPLIFHKTGVTSEQGRVVGISVNVHVKGSANRVVPLTWTGISDVQFG